MNSARITVCNRIDDIKDLKQEIEGTNYAEISWNYMTSYNNPSDFLQEELITEFKRL